MRRLMPVLLVAACCAALMGGCGGAKSTYIPASGGAGIDPAAHFSVGNIENMSGFSNKNFDISDAMKRSLQAELGKHKPTSPTNYTVNVNILQYAPGSAYARWALPGTGVGATRLSVDAIVLNQEGNQVARIPVEQSYTTSFGDGRVGAGERVFDEVAVEIVKALQQPAQRR